MKKYVHFLVLISIFALFTAFIIKTDANEVSVATTLQTSSAEKMGFWTKVALFGSAVGGYALMRRRMRRYHGGGIGCLGILLAIIGVIVAIVLLPVILIVGVVLLACGVSFRSPRRRRWRRR